MSNKYINAAISQAQSIGDPAAAHILLVLANHADQYGECFPPYELIAKETGYSRATVHRKLLLLKRQGRLQWTTIRNSQGKNVRNRYRLATATSQAETQSTSHAETSPRSQPVPKTATATSQPVQNPGLSLRLENQQEESTINRKKEPIERDAPSALALADDLFHVNGEGKEESKEAGSAGGASGTTLPDRARATRGTRLPADFNLTQADRDFALDYVPENCIQLEFDKFCDYWLAASGAKAVKLDWRATWRNWCRNVANFAPRNGKADKGNVFTLEERLRRQADRHDKGNVFTLGDRLRHEAAMMPDESTDDGIPAWWRQ
jgi:hypothetical protein